ncbi:MAG: outer membrane beta-barrel protein [Planctomycetota bacterium]|jgi:hypothetical protein
MSKLAALVPVAVIGVALAGSIAKAEGVRFGIRLAPGRASYDVDSDAESHGVNDLGDARLAMSLGATVEFGLSDRFCIETGLLYTQKGAEGSPHSEYFGLGHIPDWYSDAEIRLDYMEIPVLAKLKTAGGRFYVLGGLGLGFLKRAHMEYEYGTVSVGLMEKTTVDLGSRTHDIDLSFVWGGGVSFKAGNGRVSLGLQYAKGLERTSCDPMIGARNRVISFVFGYSF